MASKSQIKAIAKYNKENVKQYSIKLNKNTDGDLINFLDSIPNKQGFIKECIKSYMKDK